MFSSELKRQISEKVQEILQGVDHAELPKGEINFLLHVDGANGWSWANIYNNMVNGTPNIPNELNRNTSVL
jgi:hypothetical protein